MVFFRQQSVSGSALYNSSEPGASPSKLVSNWVVSHDFAGCFQVFLFVWRITYDSTIERTASRGHQDLMHKSNRTDEGCTDEDLPYKDELLEGEKVILDP